MKSVSGIRCLVLCGGLVGLLATSAQATAAPKRISGKLTEPGYTVIALAASGSAVTDRAANRRFRVRPPARKVTLHLRAPDGTYAGPVVVGARKRGRQALLGLKAGAKLRKVVVRSAKGYAKAKLSKRQAARWIDRKRWAQAQRGAPKGAGNFGRVRSNANRGVPGDLDRDGIADTLDVDRDGDLVLNDIDTKPDRQGTARAAGPGEGQGDFSAFTNLVLGQDTDLHGSPGAPIVNANAQSLSEEQIQSGMRARGTLHITPPHTPDGPVLASDIELDCGQPQGSADPGLVYCSAGGIGLLDRFGDPGNLDPNPEPFPACCDPDGDGRGFPPGADPDLLLQTRAGADQIRTGDLLLMTGKSAATGEQVELVATLETIFATVPALASYTDETGTTHQVSYPDAVGDAFSVADGPDADSDVEVTLNFWRPQRRPIADETVPTGVNWIDIGGLQYFMNIFYLPGEPGCPQGSYSDLDPNLALETGEFPSGAGPQGVPVLGDSAIDQAASPTNTFSFTFNISACAASKGATFDPGENVGFMLNALFPQSGGGQPTNTVATQYNFSHEP